MYLPCITVNTENLMCLRWCLETKFKMWLHNQDIGCKLGQSLFVYVYANLHTVDTIYFWHCKAIVQWYHPIKSFNNRFKNILLGNT